MRKSKISNGDILGMFAMRLDGNTYAQISKRYGVSIQTVCNVLKRATSGQQHSVSGCNQRLVGWMQKNHISASAMASKCGCSPQTITRFLNVGSGSIKTVKQIHSITGISYNNLIR